MIYAFYSYKGGVGRTFITAHCAISIAAKRKKYNVLAIDLDLEAPGLERYLPPKKVADLTGFAGLLNDYVENGRSYAWLREHYLDSQYVRPVAGADNLLIMPAGVGSEGQHSFADIADCFRGELGRAEDAQARDGSKEAASFFGELRALLNTKFQYVFVDSRTGLSDPAYASTIHLGNCLVCCVRLNAENLSGMRTVLLNALEKYEPAAHMPVVIVATPVPPRGGERLQDWIKLAEDLAPEIDKDDPAVMHRTLFPRVHSIWYDMELELGERLVLTSSGEPAPGYTTETPIVKAIGELTSRLLAENCDQDPIAAADVEREFYKQGAKEKSFQYLVKRLLREPSNKVHWDSIGAGYLKDEEIVTSTRRAIRTWLDRTIEEWRITLKEDDAFREPLALAHYYRASYFGKQEPDAGLTDIQAALELAHGLVVECDIEHLLGQVIEELVNRKQAQNYHDAGQPLSLELAHKHYSRGIELSLAAEKQAGNLWVHRARNSVRRGYRIEAVKDYDAKLTELAPGMDTHKGSIATVLREQANQLEHQGWYLASCRNLMGARQFRPDDPQLLRDLYLGAYNLGLMSIADDKLKDLKRLRAGDVKVHYNEALFHIHSGDWDAALSAARLAQAFAGGCITLLVLAVVHVLRGAYEEASELLNEISGEDRDSYTLGLHAYIRVHLGEADPLRELVDLKPADTHWLGTLASLANGDSQQVVNIAVDEKAVCDGWTIKRWIQLMADAFAQQWDADAAGEVDARFVAHPYLAARLRAYSEFRLIHDTWAELDAKQAFPEPAAAWLRSVIGRIESAPPPPDTLVTPRDITKPVEYDTPPPEVNT
ncbi:MAG: hypothetical protein KAY37_11010 [Phycisphaerae bacterium]|nr:hypothetical protein [Phycisphaerae bacterium]